MMMEIMKLMVMTKKDSPFFDTNDNDIVISSSNNYENGEDDYTDRDNYDNERDYFDEKRTDSGIAISSAGGGGAFASAGGGGAFASAGGGGAFASAGRILNRSLIEIPT